MSTPDLIPPDRLADRGVWRARCLNERGGLILFAVDHNHRLLPRDRGSVRELLPGENPISATEEMWALLDEVDPVPATSLGVA